MTGLMRAFLFSPKVMRKEKARQGGTDASSGHVRAGPNQKRDGA
jgi:hypothetical protein